jgi:hypothetical protein
MSLGIGTPFDPTLAVNSSHACALVSEGSWLVASDGGEKTSLVPRSIVTRASSALARVPVESEWPVVEWVVRATVPPTIAAVATTPPTIQADFMRLMML